VLFSLVHTHSDCVVQRNKTVVSTRKLLHYTSFCESNEILLRSIERGKSSIVKKCVTMLLHLKEKGMTLS
jgi:hypothetical protein